MTHQPTSASRIPSLIAIASKRLGMVLGGIAMAWLLVELLMRLLAAMNVLPLSLVEPLRSVRRAPWDAETVAPPKLVRNDNYFGNVSRRVENFRWQIAGVREPVMFTTYNWLDTNSHVNFRVDTQAWEPRWPVDIVVVGDSFSFCYSEYEDCWVQHLASEYGMSVVNLGMLATGSTSHVRVLDTFGLAYEPRIVVWQWWGNDAFEDALLDSFNEESTAHLMAGPCRDATDLEKWLYDNSVIGGIVHEYRCNQAGAAGDSYYLESGDIKLSYGSPSFRQVFDVTRNANQHGWELTNQALDQAVQLASDNDFKLVILVMPTKEEVYQKLTLPGLSEDGMAVYAEVHQEMLALCQQKNLLCFDPTTILTGHAEAGEQVYWPMDIHLNPEGNKIVADGVIEFLKSNSLIQQ